jgi:hypothetical protein
MLEFGMNLNEPNDAKDTHRAIRPAGSLYTEDELRSLAEDIVRYTPSLCQLLLALGSTSVSNPLRGMN